MKRMKSKVQWSILTKFIFVIGWVLCSGSLGLYFYQSMFTLSKAKGPPRCPELPPIPPASLTHPKFFFDKSREFAISMFRWVGSEWESQDLLCLASQASVDRLHHLVELVQRWSGPVSLTLFTPGLESQIAERFLSYLRMCFPEVLARVAIHTVHPVAHPPVHTNTSLTNSTEIQCFSPSQTLNSLLEEINYNQTRIDWRETYPYPQNLLRNLAKSGCPTNYTIIPDIDMVPGYKNMFQDLEKFLHKQDSLAHQCPGCAYVIPTYEVSRSSPSLPSSKRELLAYKRAGQARQFHMKVWKLNQKASNLARWERWPLDHALAVAYKIPKYSFFYEPIYVSRAEVPLFDERFIGYGMTRNTQAYEMNLAGYQFLVLNNAFSLHWGFQEAEYPEWRKLQIKENEKRFKDLQRELKERYAASTASTPILKT